MSVTTPPANDATGPAPEVLSVIERRLEEVGETVIGLSHDLHADPELSGQEVRAARRVRRILADHGFEFPDPQPLAPTAFSARFGRGSLVATFCVEYDALPGIGHGCGHNVNAASALGAALSLTDLADDLGLTVHVLGTPAEESHGGKVDLIDEGFFADSHLALMAHAAGEDSVGGTSLALSAWDVTFTGRPAHAAIAPHAGVNALDALTVAQTAIGLARQQLPPGSVVSLIVTAGGDAVNVIPDRATAVVEMRAPRRDQLDAVMHRVECCLRAGALASGAEVDIAPQGHPSSELSQDAVLTERYAAVLRLRGRDAVLTSAPTASTDMGNVSQVVPSLHPMIGFQVSGAAHHTAEFAEHSAGPSADAAVLDAAFGLAATVGAVAADDEQRARLERLARTRTVSGT